MSKKTRIKRGFKAVIEATATLLRAIDDFKQNYSDKDDDLFLKMAEFSEQKLLTIRNANELDHFTAEVENFRQANAQRLQKLEQYVKAIDDAEKIFFSSTVDFGRLKQEVINAHSLKDDSKQYEQEMQDKIKSWQRNILKKYYGNERDETAKNEKWENKRDAYEDATPEGNAFKNDLNQAQTFIGSLAEQGNLARLKAKPEYYQLRIDYDNLRSFFSLAGNIAARREFLLLQEQRDAERYSDEQYLQQDFTSSLNLDNIKKEFSVQADIVAGKRQYISINDLYGEDDRLYVEDDRSDNDYFKIEHEVSPEKIIITHNAMHRTIAAINSEIVKLGSIENELREKAIKWSFTPVKLGIETDPRDKKIAQLFAEKERAVRENKKFLQAQRDQFVATYNELRPIVEAHINQYRNKINLEAFYKRQERFNVLAEKLEKDSTQAASLASELKRLEDLQRINTNIAHEFQAVLSDHHDLEHVFEWEKNNIQYEITQQARHNPYTQLYKNQEHIYVRLNFLLKNIELQLINAIKDNTPSDRLQAARIDELKDLYNQAILFIAHDLKDWQQSLLLKIKNTESAPALNDYQFAEQQLSHYVMQDILTSIDIDHRTLVLERWIQIMHFSLYEGDYASVSAIRNALLHNQIQGLEKTWLGIPIAERQFVERVPSQFDYTLPNRIPPHSYFEENHDTLPNNDLLFKRDILDKLEALTYSDLHMEPALFAEKVESLKSLLRKSNKKFLFAFDIAKLSASLKNPESPVELEELKDQAKALVNKILPSPFPQKESTVMPALIMQVDAQETARFNIEILEGASASDSNMVKEHEKGKEKVKSQKNLHVQPSIVAANLFRNETAAPAILNPIIRFAVASRADLANNPEFIRQVNEAATNTGDHKQIEKILIKYKVKISDYETLKKHNDQIYYHHQILNPVLSAMLANVYLQSTNPQYSNIELLIKKINDTIFHPVDDNELTKILREIGFSSVNQKQIAAIQAENSRLHAVTEKIGYENGGSRKTIRKLSLDWLEKNKAAYITPNNLYTVTVLPPEKPKKEKSTAAKSDKVLTDNIALALEVLSEILKQMIAALNEALVENTHTPLLSAQGIFKEKVPSDKSKQERESSLTVSYQKRSRDK